MEPQTGTNTHSLEARSCAVDIDFDLTPNKPVNKDSLI